MVKHERTNAEQGQDCPPMSPRSGKTAIKDFYKAFRPIQDAYAHGTFAFFALKRPQGVVIQKAAIFLGCLPLICPSYRFDSQRVRAGAYKLEELGVNFETLIDQVCSGSIPTPDGPLLFPAISPGRPEATFDGFHMLGGAQQRLSALTLSGVSQIALDQPSLDWEIKANDMPHHGVVDLLSVFDLGPLSGSYSTVDVITFGAATIDATSKIDDTKASLVVRLAEGLHSGKVTLGCIVDSQGRRVARSVIEADQIVWTREDGVQLGRAELAVPRAALLNCILRYDGVALQYWWVTDPSRAQNPRRAAYEAVDPNLEVIRDYLAGTGQRPQHDFGTGVARLLWLLGFAPAHLGGGHLQSADIVATTPRGDIVVAECTTGLLKGDKRSQLIERTDAIRKRIDGSHVRILPVMVTSMTRVQVRAWAPRHHPGAVTGGARSDVNDAQRRCPV
jgi:hypothetical protein